MSKDIECIDREGKCFARSNGKCRVLDQAFLPCSFKKPDPNVTNGKTYHTRYKNPGATNSPALDKSDIPKEWVELDGALEALSCRTGFSKQWLKSVLSKVERVYQ